MDGVRREVEHLISDSRNIINVTERRLLSKDNYVLKTDRKKDQPRSFYENLLKLYHEGQLKCNSEFPRDLLPKFVEEFGANCIVFKIYGDQKMFNVEVKRGMITCYESQLTSYDDETLMDFLDSGEVPPIIVTSLTIACKDMDLFSKGGVISQLRFYKSSGSIAKMTSSFYVYLKLFSESRLALQHLYEGNPDRSQEEMRDFEYRMMVAAADALCLDPDPKVSIVSNNLMYEKKLFAHPELKRNSQRNLSEVKAKRRALNCVQTTPLIEAMRAMVKNNFFSDEPVDVAKNEAVEKKPAENLYAAANFDLKSMNKKICRIPPLKRPKDNSVFQSEEDKLKKMYFLESQLDEEHHEFEQNAMITITKNTADKLYRGTLTQCYEPDMKAKSVSHTFPLGSKDAVDRFTDQFIDLFTEAGYKPTMIQQSGPGVETKTEYTPFLNREPKDHKGTADVVKPAPSTSFMMENILFGSTPLFSRPQDPVISKIP